MSLGVLKVAANVTGALQPRVQSAHNISQIAFSFPQSHYTALQLLMPIFSTWWQTFTSSPFCLLTFHINVKMAANKPSEQNGTRLAKCLPDYTPHFLPDLCSSFRGSFPPRITKFNKNFLLQRVGNSSLKNAVHKALWLNGTESFSS